MSRLDRFARHEDTASISAQRNQDLATCTGAPEDGGQVLCLWADLVNRCNGNFPAHCRLGAKCCLVDDRYWDDVAPEAPAYTNEQLFS